jgi:hypothetical protein
MLDHITHSDFARLELLVFTTGSQPSAEPTASVQASGSRRRQTGTGAA